MNTKQVIRRASPLFQIVRLSPYIVGALAFAGMLLVILLAGCASVEKAIYTTQRVTVPEATNMVPVVTVTTNAAGQVTHTTNNWPVIIPAHQASELAKSPAVTGFLDVLKVAPVPFGSTVAILLGGLYAGYARVRKSKDVSVALVQGVESFREWLQGTPEGRAADIRLLDYLKSHQEQAGVLNDVAALVNAHTGNTVP